MIPNQKSTYGGWGVILYQLSSLLEKVNIGDFWNYLSMLTYGQIILDYTPIIGGVLLILFNEEKE